ncbi:hypothetical protein B0H19DRAFT_1115053 [Mycena capillaripes]|nr:hypothetical protein B0H19DRAFT_1115053 [Mycena capillaripes]
MLRQSTVIGLRLFSWTGKAGHGHPSCHQLRRDLTNSGRECRGFVAVPRQLPEGGSFAFLMDDASSKDQDGKVEPPEAENDPDANVDNNVIASEDENIAEKKDETPAPPPKRSMPMLTNLADLTLNSPSSMIVGTPFSDNNTRFEYPFPDNKTSTSNSPEMSSKTPPQNSPTFSSLSSSPSSSALVSASQPQLVLNSPPTLQHYPASFPPPSELPSYSPTHPKMRAVDPPVPPALVKRRQRFTLGLGALSRKLSLRSGSAPTGPVSPGVSTPDGGHRRALSDERAGGNKTLTLSPTQEGPSAPKDGGPDGTGAYT